MEAYASKLIKAYFNSFNSKLEDNIKFYNMRLKHRIFKLNKIFVGKPEFKHTSDKVIITLYVYNSELNYYINKIRKIENPLYKRTIIDNTMVSINDNNLYTIKKLYTKFLSKISYLNSKYINKYNNGLFNLDKLFVLNLIKKMLIKIRLCLQIKKIKHINNNKYNSIHMLFIIK